MNALSMNKEEYLKKTQEYQEERKRVQQDPWRLAYHIMPESGWLNDPNGLCQFHGTYHFYYQYSPFDVNGKVKLWGHVTSSDLIHWQQQEPLLFPDSRDDIRGVYSGSAYIHQDTLYLYYTGNVKLMDQSYDYIHTGREQNTMLVTSKDGYSISEKQCLLRNADYPDTMSCHIRDPKLYEHQGHTYLVLGGRTRHEEGCVLVYETNDLHHFTYRTTIKSAESFGYMWECPDLFDLDGQTILVTCPQGVPSQGERYQNVYQCGYYFLHGDVCADVALSAFTMLDYGFDFYAPQSFVDEKGRRILVGWMGMPDIPYTNPSAARGWQHALTLPRVLSIHKGILYQTPVEELQNLRRRKISCLCSELQNYQLCERVFECQVTVKEAGSFSLRLRADTRFSYNDETKRCSLTLGEEGYGRDQRSVTIDLLDNFIIYSDTSSLEIFVNDGAQVFTTRVYEETAVSHLKFEDCKMQGNVVWYQLDPYVWE